MNAEIISPIKQEIKGISHQSAMHCQFNSSFGSGRVETLLVTTITNKLPIYTTSKPFDIELWIVIDEGLAKGLYTPRLRLNTLVWFVFLLVLKYTGR